MRGFSIVIVCLVALSAPTNAQVQRTYWGVEAAVAPKWRVPSWQEALFDAQSVDLSGAEFRVGFVRAKVLGSDWGVVVMRRSIKEKAAAVLDNDGIVISTTSDTSLTGVEVNGFAPFKTIGRRFQIGIAYGVGAGFYGGEVPLRRPDGTTTLVNARALFSPGDDSFSEEDDGFPVQPLVRVELGGAFIASPNFKIRASGGLNFPGQHVISLSAIYMFAPR